MPGWKPPNLAVSAVLCLLVGVAAWADEPADDRSGQALSAAFLEFLGEWEDQQGNWQDPLEFDDPKWWSLDDDAERQHETD